MPVFKLLARLIAYYAVLAVVISAVLWLFPALREYLPIGRAQTLITQAGGALEKGQASIQVAHLRSLGASLVWLVSAIGGALLTSLPVSWVYTEIRDADQCDPSLIDTIVLLPLVVTSIVVIVQDSLALSFSLAGIAGAARFRNTLKSSGDLLFILLAVGIGLSAGIGAMELAIVTSAAFNFCFVALWFSGYGERKGKKRYLSDRDVAPQETATTMVGVAAVALATVVATEAKAAGDAASGS